MSEKISDHDSGATKNQTKRELEELKKLVSKNQYYLQSLIRYTKKIDKFLFWFQIKTIGKIILIVAPLIVAYFYFIPWLQSIIDKYKSILTQMVS